MSVIYPILLVVHVLFSLGLIIVVLLQSSKGEGLAGAFGGGQLSGAVFGGRGAATFLSKATTFIAIGFMITSVSLFMSFGLRGAGGTSSGVLENLQDGTNQIAPPPATSVPGEVPLEGEGEPANFFEETAPADTGGN